MEKDDARLARAADKVLGPLERLVAEMGRHEPGLGINEAEFVKKGDKHLQIRFRARPISVAFTNSSRRITVSVVPTDEMKPLD